MKVRVRKYFEDKKAGKFRHAGDIFEVTPERFEEIALKLPGFLEIVSIINRSEELEPTEENQTEQADEQGTTARKED